MSVTGLGDPCRDCKRLPRARRVPIFRGSDTDAKEAYYYHAAGVDGMGSASYIDDVVACYADKNSGWTSAADSTKEFKYYPLQNRRHDVVLNSAGKLLEAVKYLRYGTPIALPAVRHRPRVYGVGGIGGH